MILEFHLLPLDLTGFFRHSSLITRLLQVSVKVEIVYRLFNAPLRTSGRR